MRSLILTLDVPEWAEAYVQKHSGIKWLRLKGQPGSTFWETYDGRYISSTARVVLLKKEE